MKNQSPHVIVKRRQQTKQKTSTLPSSLDSIQYSQHSNPSRYVRARTDGSDSPLDTLISHAFDRAQTDSTSPYQHDNNFATQHSNNGDVVIQRTTSKLSFSLLQYDGVCRFYVFIVFCGFLRITVLLCPVVRIC